MELVNVYFSRGGFLKRYNIFIVLDRYNKKEIEETFKGTKIKYSTHKSYGETAEIIFHTNKKGAKQIVKRLSILEKSALGEEEFSRLVKAIE
ncbi:MAG: hypothetical protein J7K73_02525 [Nanoarchaeota archaeon]|nr:hypothetical protein [Nanoarchaeota archaeon]